MKFRTNICIPVKVPLRRAELTTSAQPQGLQTRPVTTERKNLTHLNDHPLINPTYKSNRITSRRKFIDKKGSNLFGYSPQNDESNNWNTNILVDPNKRNQLTYKAPFGVSKNHNSTTIQQNTLERKIESRKTYFYEKILSINDCYLSQMIIFH
jgi:hypothetical protein